MAGKEVGSLNPQQMKLVWQTIQQLIQSGLLTERRAKRQAPVDVHRIWVKNASSETIPAFACMAVTGVVQYEGRPCVTVNKPTSACGQFVFNSEHPIEPVADDGAGWAYAHGIIKMAGSGSFVGCERYTAVAGQWTIQQGPGQFVCYGEGEDEVNTFLLGRIVGDYCQARYILGHYDPEDGSTTILEYWEGNDPEECGTVTVTYPLGTPHCEADIVAIWDTNSGEYKAIASKSAMLGDPVTQSVVRSIANDSCGVLVGKTPYYLFPADDDCEGAITTEPVELGAEIPVIVAMGSDECGKIYYAYQNINAFLCGSSPATTSFDIDFGDAKFVTDITFGPPECDGVATWTWTSPGEWVLTTPCSSGCESAAPVGDGTTFGETTTVSCASSPGQDNCGLVYTKRGIGEACDPISTGGPSPNFTTVYVPIPLEEQVVIVSASIETDGLEFIRKKLYVCGVADADPLLLETYECPTEEPPPS